MADLPPPRDRAEKGETAPPRQRAPSLDRRSARIAPTSITEASRDLCQQAVISPSTLAGDRPPSRVQLLDLHAEISAGRVPDQLKRACAAQGLKLSTLATAVARLIDAKVHEHGWTGYLKHGLTKLLGVSYRVVRRIVKVLRAVGIFLGDTAQAYRGEDGKLRRDPSTFLLALPGWARSAHWGRSKRTAKPAKPLVAPSGQRWPHPSVPSLSEPSDAYKTKGEDTQTPVDSAPPWPRPPLPDAYLAERAALDSRNAAANTGRAKRRRRR